MKLYVVRHGETVGNVKGITQSWLPGKLTKLGEEQAKKLAKRLAGESIDIIYCSDLRRCRQTLAPLLKLRKEIPTNYVKELRERYMGIFEGKSYKISKKWRDSNGSKFDDKVPKGESFIDVEKRMVRFFNKIFKKHKGEKVLFVTHGTAKRALIISLLNRRDKKRHKKYHSDNTALSIIKINDDGKHKAHLINSTRHLK